MTYSALSALSEAMDTFASKRKRPRHVRIPHLDGLRALAIAGVLLFHFDIPGFAGGFIGVDMFFTISGFLITRNILLAIDAGSFSLWQFYKRRFFRLYPASLAVIAATLAVSHVFIRPAYHHVICQSAVAALTFCANIFFHLNGEYFAATFDMRPLLHFWSLSVEEQFYAIWPALLLISCSIHTHVVSRLQNASAASAYKNKLGTLQAILITFLVVSLAFATYVYQNHATFAFYQLPARAFQFAAGALLGIILDRKGVFDKWNDCFEYMSIPMALDQDELAKVSSASSTSALHANGEITAKAPAGKKKPYQEINDFNDILSVGMTAVVIFSFMFLPPRPSPLYSIPITIATCVLIAMPHSVVCEVFFCSPSFAWLGRLSYSVYLVHWPLAILGVYIFDGLGIPMPKVGFLFISLWLGEKLHRYVEVPLRFGTSVKHRIALFLGLLVTLVFALTGAVNGGFKSRFPEEGKTGWPEGVAPTQYWDVCTDVRSHFTPEDPNFEVCRVGAVHNGTASNFYFFGDSFTGHLRVALHHIGLRRGVFFDLRFVNFCGFRTLNHPKSQSRSPQGFLCADTVQHMWEHMRYLPNGSTVVVANWWAEPAYLRATLLELRAALAAQGKKFAVVAEPPGMSKTHRSTRGYYACADMSVLPIGRFLHKMIRGDTEEVVDYANAQLGMTTARRKIPFRGALRCVDFVKGFPPGQSFAQEQKVFMDAFSTALNDSKLVNVFPRLCQVSDWSNPAWPKYSCRPPVYTESGVVYDIGYEPDLTHLTSVGSYNVSTLIEEDLYGPNEAEMGSEMAAAMAGNGTEGRRHVAVGSEILSTSTLSRSNETEVAVAPSAVVAQTVATDVNRTGI